MEIELLNVFQGIATLVDSELDVLIMRLFLIGLGCALI